MKLEGRIEIAAPAERVWAELVDPVSLAACVPGVQQVVAVDERTFDGSVVAAVGPMEARFAFRSTIERQDFPTDLDVQVAGSDTLTKSPLVASVHAWLETPEPARTVLAYRATVTVKGRLAILGEMVLRATAGVLIGEVARCLRARTETAGGVPAAGEAGR